MRLTESIQITRENKLYNELDRFCFLSKNLYNSSLYAIRQHFFNTKKYKNYNSLNKDFIQSHQIDYYALPTKVSQQTMKMVDQNFKSFFGLLKLKSKKAKIPKYLKKQGRYEIIFTIQSISQKELKKGFLKLSGINQKIKIRDTITNIQQVRIIPKETFNCYNIEIVYKVSEKQLKKDNKKYASIDLGINNIATVAFNCEKPFIINGKPLKSINQYYNKKRSKLTNIKTRKAKLLNRKRDNKIKDYLHKASRYITNHLVYNNINTLIIGKNDGWKQEVNIGKKNNQNFVSIPFEKFIFMLQYKCNLEGINVIIREESYTSKCSFIDNEEIKKHETYLGRRIKRGLFKTAFGKIINADLNGSLNIMRKVVGEFQYPIEACSTPVMVTLQN